MAKKKYISPEGYEYSSYQEYVNSPDLDSDLIQVKLFTGQRKPQNKDEEEILREIKKAREKGKYLEIYPE